MTFAQMNTGGLDHQVGEDLFSKLARQLEETIEPLVLHRRA